MKKVKIIIPKELEEVLKTIKDKRKKKSLIYIYNAFVYKYQKYDKDNEYDYFQIPSTYLKKIRTDYKKFVQLLLDHNIIEYKSVNKGMQINEDIFSDDIFYDRKYYNTHTGDCMYYRLLIDVDKGIEIDIEINNKIYINEPWYDITKKSLEDIYLPIRITRDSFGRRLHTPLTGNTGVKNYESYWHYLSSIKGYSVIDVKSCVPTLLFNYLKDKVDIDENYDVNKIYDLINPIDRNKAKKEFATWLNCEVKKMPRHINKLFPKISKYIIEYKEKYDSKSIGKKMQLKETSIIIDDILSNIQKELNIDFCLTIHDSLIIRNEDEDIVYNWVSSRYKELSWSREKIK